MNVENKAGSHAAGVDYGADNVPVKLFTGELVLLKYGDGNVNNALANAEFVLYKDGEEVPLTFTKQENGKYKYAPDAEDATATLVTDENGMIDVEGLHYSSVPNLCSSYQLCHNCLCFPQVIIPFCLHIS